MERYWQNTWQYKRILEILDDYWITEKDETFVQIVMHFKKGDKEQHKTIVWFNPKLIPDIDADPDIPSTRTYHFRRIRRHRHRIPAVTEMNLTRPSPQTTSRFSDNRGYRE